MIRHQAGKIVEDPNGHVLGAGGMKARGAVTADKAGQGRGKARVPRIWAPLRRAVLVLALLLGVSAASFLFLWLKARSSGAGADVEGNAGVEGNAVQDGDLSSDPGGYVSGDLRNGAAETQNGAAETYHGAAETQKKSEASGTQRGTRQQGVDSTKESLQDLSKDTSGGEGSEGAAAGAQEYNKNADSSSTTREQHQHVSKSKAKLEEIQQYFDKVLLVVSFERLQDAQRHVRFLKQLYGRVFRRLLFVGPAKMDVGGVTVLEAVRRPYTDFSKSGPFIYDDMSFNYAVLKQLALAYHRERLDGILWVDHRTILNYWGLLEGDKDRVWLPPLNANDTEKKRVWSIVNVKHADLDDSVTDEDWTKKANWKKELKRFLKMLPQLYKNQLQQSMKALIKALGPTTSSGEEADEQSLEHLLPRAPPAILYIPGSRVSELNVLTHFLFLAKVPGEVAVPTLGFIFQEFATFDDVLNSFIFVSSNDPLGHATVARNNHKPESSGLYPWPFHIDGTYYDLMYTFSIGDESISQADISF